MADMLIKMKTGTLTKMLQQQNGQPAVSLDKGSVYFAVDTATHKGKIIYDAPLDPNGVDRIVMSTDAETAEKDSAGNVITSTYATKAELNSYLPDNVMVYIGTMATANDVPNVYKAGWTYKVVTAGTYAGKICEVGDLVICTKDNNDAASASNDDWIVIQTNVDKALYKGTNSFTNGYMLLADGTAGKVKAVNVNPTITLTAGTASSSPKFKFSVGGKESNEVSIGTATETNFGAVKISSATDSNDDLTAATSAAVKAVYDFAATKTSNVGTITGVTAGAGLTGGGTSGNVTLSHSNSIAATTTEALYKLKYDAQGHITGALAQGITDNTSNKDVTSTDNNLITARTLYYQLAKKGYTTNTGTVISVGSGEGLTGGPITTTGSLSHAIPEDAEAGTKGTAGGRTYLQQITTDKFGHVTGFLTATETVTDTHHTAKIITTNSDTSKTQTTTALTNGNVYLNVVENNTVRSHHKISGTNLIGVTTDTSGNIKIDHTAPTGASATTYGGGNRTYVTSITSDAYGHITGVLTGQETVSNTDTKVNVTLGTTTKAYLLGTSTAPTSSAQAVEAISDTGVYLDTTAGKLTASSFAGSGASLTSLNASNISSGTLNAARLATSGVTAGVYQGLTIDTYGRVTGAIDKDYATKTELNNLIAAADALVYKGTLAGANTSPGAFTPAADCGHVYKVSTGGYINGQKVEAGDMFICTADSTVAATSSNYSTVQATWSIVQTNADGIVIGPGSATNGNIPLFDGTTGKLIKNSSYKPSSFATSGHTHDISLASGGTSTVDLAANTAYTLTAGGKSVVFKTPADTTYGANRGISLSSGNFGHSNSAITAQGTQALYPIKIDAYGHITGYGTAVTSLPASDVYAWAKAATKPTYTASEVGAATSGHTHTTSLASDTGTSTVTLTSGGKFKLTAGGTSVIFTMPTSNNYSHPTGDGNLHVPATGTTNNGKFLKAGSTAGSISWASLSSSDITTALGFTPYNATNPSGYTTNTGTVTKVTAGTGLTTTSGSSTDGGNFTTSGTLYLTKTAVTAGSYGPSANASPAHAAGFSVPYFTVDAYGRITAASTKTITLPSDNNTDTKVTQTATTTNANYEILFSETADNTTRTEAARKTSGLKFNPSTNGLQLSSAVTLQYNSTTKSLDFIFA